MFYFFSLFLLKYKNSNEFNKIIIIFKIIFLK